MTNVVMFPNLRSRRSRHRQVFAAPANALELTELRELLGLTNHHARADVYDDGITVADSLFKRLLHERLDELVENRPDVAFAGDAWIVTARNDPSRIAGWSLLTSRSPMVRSGDVGFYVHPDFRRTGVGSTLVDRIIILAREQGYRRLVASPWNTRTETFFGSVGFRSVYPHNAPHWNGQVELHL